MNDDLLRFDILRVQNVKAYLRRGTARESLIRYKEAAQGERILVFLYNLDLLVFFFSFVFSLFQSILFVMQILSMLLFSNHTIRLLILPRKD